MLSTQRHCLQSSIFPNHYKCLLSTYCLLSTSSGLNTYCVPDPVWVGRDTVTLRAPLVQEGMTHGHGRKQKVIQAREEV